MQKKFSAMFFVILFTAPGCTNYLYSGKLDAIDSYGQNRKFVLSWTKMDPFLGSPKAGPATLRTEVQCSRTLSFDEKPNGIFFLGEPGRDIDAIHNTPVSSQDHICGKFLKQSKFVDIQGGSLSLTVSCNPVKEVNEFSVHPGNQGYLKARTDPYTFDIQETKKEWSFQGKTLEIPSPQCSSTP